MNNKALAKRLRAALDTEKITAWMESKPPRATAGECINPHRCVIANYLREQFPNHLPEVSGVCAYLSPVHGGRGSGPVALSDECRLFIGDWDDGPEFRTFSTSLKLWRKHMYEEVAA